MPEKSKNKRHNECPFESKKVRCAYCNGPYNIDIGVRPIYEFELELYRLPKGESYVLGGRCNNCGSIIGKQLHNNSNNFSP